MFFRAKARRRLQSPVVAQVLESRALLSSITTDYLPTSGRLIVAGSTGDDDLQICIRPTGTEIRNHGIFIRGFGGPAPRAIETDLSGGNDQLVLTLAVPTVDVLDIDCGSGGTKNVTVQSLRPSGQRVEISKDLFVRSEETAATKVRFERVKMVNAMDDSELSPSIEMLGTSADTLTLIDSEFRFGRKLSLGEGNDALYCYGGSFTSFSMSFGNGDDLATFSGVKLAGQLNFGAGNDRLEITRGICTGTVSMGEGTDAVRLTHTRLDTQNFWGGDGFDSFVLTSYDWNFYGGLGGFEKIQYRRYAGDVS